MTTTRPSPEALDAADASYSRAVSLLVIDLRQRYGFLVVPGSGSHAFVHRVAADAARAAIARVDRHRERSGREGA